MTDRLPLDAKIALIGKMVDDLDFYKETGSSKCPNEQHYSVVSRDEDLAVEQHARFAAFKKLDEGIRKVAFDTRRIDQEKDRNPRRNLQNWHRSEPFIDDETKEKLAAFSKLEKVVQSLKGELSDQPEWFDSYVRALSNNLDRLQMKRAGDKGVEVYKPHVSYLEQIVYNRYRLTLDDVKDASEKKLRKILLAKDDDLKGREEFLMSTGGFNTEKNEKHIGETSRDDLLMTMAQLLAQGNSGNSQPIIIQQPQQEEQSPKDAASALFGSPLRRAGEKSVERTITIKIIDSVVE